MTDFSKLNKNFKPLFKLAILEDISNGDITTEAIDKNSNGKAIITAKENLVICGLMLLNQIYKFPRTNIKIEHFCQDGDWISKGGIITELTGKISKLILYERIALNFLQKLSGIATLTKNLSTLLKNTSIKLLDTRKTTPGYRVLEKYAVQCGGGLNHRMGLYDQYLIKDNHIKLAGGISAAIKMVKQYNKKKLKVEIECKTINQVKEVLKENKIEKTIDIIMLDNFTIPQIKNALTLIQKKCLVEVSGNMNLTKIKQIKKITQPYSVNFISAGILTHSARTVDLSMNITKLLT